MKIEKMHVIKPEALDGTSLCVLAISEMEVSTKNYYRFDESAKAMHNAGKKSRCILLPSFMYDHDPREIYEIPELVSYAREMMKKNPELFYYITPDAAVARPFYPYVAEYPHL